MDRTGLEYEADPRQCERLLEGLQLDDSCNGAATPGIKPLPAQIDLEQPLPPDKQSEFRGLAADLIMYPPTELIYSMLRRNVVVLCLHLGHLPRLL